MNDTERFPLVMPLRDASPILFDWMTHQLIKLSLEELRLQMVAVWLIRQQLAGTEKSDSFMAYPLPRLNTQQRQATAFVGAISHSLT